MKESEAADLLIRLRKMWDEPFIALNGYRKPDENGYMNYDKNSKMDISGLTSRE